MSFHVFSYTTIEPSNIHHLSARKDKYVNVLVCYSIYYYLSMILHSHETFMSRRSSNMTTIPECVSDTIPTD